MATKKITITLDDEQVQQIRNLVADGRAASVSGFVQHAVGVALDDVAGWGAMLARALDDSGGPMTDEERAWADAALGGASADDDRWRDDRHHRGRGRADRAGPQ